METGTKPGNALRTEEGNGQEILVVDVGDKVSEEDTEGGKD